MQVSQRVAIRKRVRKGKYRTVYVVKTYTRNVFKSETSKYVKQYHWIEEYVQTLRAEVER
jgi:hypothetical protein